MVLRDFIMGQAHRFPSSALCQPSQLLTRLLCPKQPLPGSFKKKALLIAISYIRAPSGHDRLAGPQQDVKRLRSLLISQYEYEESAIVVMTDAEDPSSSLYPISDNIMREVKSFLQDQQPGDQYFFYFAGHSAQLPGETEDEGEEDGRDEIIVPLEACMADRELDFKRTIIDNELKVQLVDQLNPKTRLVAIFDSCQSATLLDLPHHRCNRVYNCTSRLRRLVRWALECGRGILNLEYSTTEMLGLARRTGARINGQTGGAGMTIETGKKEGKKGPARDGERKEFKPKKSCSGFCLRLPGHKNNVISISACKDSQCTWDGLQHKSMTAALMDLLEIEQRPALKKVMRELSSRPRYSKEGEPQLSSRFPLRANSLFKI
ncbi:peptidase C14, caspase domain-containing protein [Lyophyllum atratum]|nr:peptidase C14, caspase domain-containing protein [Lyophyllum atratum]